MSSLFPASLASAVALLLTPCALVAQTLAVTNVRIVDPETSAASAVTTIVVENDRIVSVGQAAIPAGARVVDGRGGFVVPGLWDMHAHFAALTPIGRAPEHYVGNGVLHARDMGGFTDSLLPLRRATTSGERVGPDFVLAGPTLNGIEPAQFHRMVTTDAEARTAVRELQELGVDFIKVHRAMGREAFDAVIDEARRQGLTVSGHVPLVMGWADAADAGMRTIEHVQTIFENVERDGARLVAEFNAIADRIDGPLGDSIFAVMRARGTFFDPTLIGYETSIARASPAVAALRRVAFERMKPIVLRAAKAGVPIVTGTDVLEGHGEMLLRELELLAAIGLSPRDVLRAATVTSADAAFRPEAGRLRVGAPASFLVLRANPLEDVRSLRSLALVVLRGRVFDELELELLRR